MSSIMMAVVITGRRKRWTPRRRDGRRVYGSQTRCLWLRCSRDRAPLRVFELGLYDPGTKEGGACGKLIRQTHKT